MSNFELAKAVNTRLRSAHHEWDTAPLFHENRDVKGEIVSQIAFAIAEAEIEYLTIEVNDSDGYISVLVFSGTRIIDTRYFTESGKVRTRVHSFDGIEKVLITSTPNVFTSSLSSSGSAEAEITIDGIEFTLPGDEKATRLNSQELENFLPKLTP